MKVYDIKKERNWVCDCPEGFIYSVKISEGLYCKCKNPILDNYQNRIEMYEMRVKGRTNEEIAKTFNTTKSNVSHIINEHIYANNL